ncbi:MAG: type II secretion system protein [Alphaproteobacteria bacterium]
MNGKRGPHRQSGFTLIELAIVLVIIGLLAGGVLVGTDLIKSARVNAQIAQLDSFRAAFSTFRDKYGGLPGDLTPTRATPFGFAARAGTPGSGDGNGLVQSGNHAGNGVYTLLLVAGETALVWTDLGQAGLIPGTFLGKDCVQASGGCTDTLNATGTNPVSSVIPRRR